MQDKAEKHRGSFSLYQIKAKAADVLPGAEFTGKLRGILPGEKFFIDVSIYGKGIGSADNCLFQKEDVEGIGSKQMVMLRKKSLN